MVTVDNDTERLLFFDMIRCLAFKKDSVLTAQLKEICTAKGIKHALQVIDNVDNTRL